MKLSFSTLACPDYNVNQVIRLAADNGYDGVEIRTLENTVDIWNLSDFRSGNIAKTRRLFRDAGLEIVVLGTGVKFNQSGRNYQSEQINAAKVFLWMAAELGCPYIRTFLGPIEGLTQEEHLLWSIDGYDKLVELASSYGVKILLETHDDFSTASTTIPFLKEMNGEVGVIWDILHSYRHKENITDTYQALSSYISHVHLKDAINLSEEGFQLVLTGKGEVPIKETISFLKKQGYKNYLSFEWEKFWHPEIENSSIAVPHFIETVKEWLTLMEKD